MCKLRCPYCGSDWVTVWDDLYDQCDVCFRRWEAGEELDNESSGILDDDEIETEIETRKLKNKKVKK